MKPWSFEFTSLPSLRLKDKKGWIKRGRQKNKNRRSAVILELSPGDKNLQYSTRLEDPGSSLDFKCSSWFTRNLKPKSLKELEKSIINRNNKPNETKDQYINFYQFIENLVSDTEKSWNERWRTKTSPEHHNHSIPKQSRTKVFLRW